MLVVLRARLQANEERDARGYYLNRVKEAQDRGTGMESVLYSLVYTAQREAANKGGPLTAAQSGKLSAISVQTAEGVELQVQPARVLAAVRDAMQEATSATPVSHEGTRLMLEWARQHLDVPEAEDRPPLVSSAQWCEQVFTPLAFQRAVRRMRPSGQAAGYDGWLGVHMRWAPWEVQDLYRRALCDAVANPGEADNYPRAWRVQICTHIPKPGKSITDVCKMRDLWNCCHGWKIVTVMLLPEFERANQRARPESQRGFRAHADAGEAAMAAGVQAEEAALLCTGLGRTLVDFKGFFMNVVRGLAYSIQSNFGVLEGVTRCLKTLHDVMEGKANTAYGAQRVVARDKGHRAGLRVRAVPEHHAARDNHVRH